LLYYFANIRIIFKMTKFIFCLVQFIEPDVF